MDLPIGNPPLIHNSKATIKSRNKLCTTVQDIYIKCSVCESRGVFTLSFMNHINPSVNSTFDLAIEIVKMSVKKSPEFLRKIQDDL